MILTSRLAEYHIGQQLQCCDIYVTIVPTVHVSERMFQSVIPTSHIIHAAGATSDASLMRQTPAHVRQVFAPKVLSFKTRVYENKPIANCIFFSSIVAILSSSGQANYACANATLDTLSRVEYTSGRPICSIRWGAWGGVGMAVRNRYIEKNMKRLGIDFLDPRDALSVLEDVMFRLVHAPMTCTGVLNVYQRTPSVSSNHICRVFQRHDVDIHDTKPINNESTEHGDCHARGLVRNDSQEYVSILCQMASSLIGGDVDPDVPLHEAGMDSLSAVEFANILSSHFHRRFAPSLVFDYPTISKMCEYISQCNNGGKITESAQAIIVRIMFQSRRILHQYMNACLRCYLAPRMNYNDL